MNKIITTKFCKTCEKELPPTRRKFCTDKCQQDSHNFKWQSYQSQQKRGWQRKAYLVRLLGGGCAVCGFSGNLAALDFHHKDPRTKTLGLTIRECSNNKWELLLQEAAKCEVLCRNCHADYHHPHGRNWEINYPKP